MTFRSLVGSAIVVGGLVLSSEASAGSAGPTAANEKQPTQASVSSRISEVDACNLAQYQMPSAAVLQGFRFGTSRDKEGPLFSCTVSWSNDSKAAPTDRPILFPNSVHIPLIWSGWL